MGRGMDRAGAGRAGSAGPAARSTLQQVRLLQDLIDISLSNLRGLRTKCAASNDLTQHEIRTLEAKLMDYIYRQRQCKLSVPLNDRTKELSSYPRFNDWLDVVNVRKEVVQRIPEELTLDALLEMNESKVKETMKRCGAREEECSRLNGALSCLRKVTETGGELKDDLLWSLPDARRENSSAQLLEPFCAPIPTWTHGISHLAKGNSPQLRSVSVSTLPSSESLALSQGPSACSDNNLLDLCSFPAHGGRVTPRTPHSITITPPTTPQSKRKQKFKPPRTPPPPSRKVFHLFPNFPTLTRSKSHESQLGNRIDELPPVKFDIPHISPQMVRRDIGLSVTHRFSTKSWLSQMCHVCQRSMMFGVKCKHCRLKCHNKCTKEAPACRIISFFPLTKIRRTESVPSDINNPVDRPSEPQFGTLPKALTKKDHPSVINHLDSSSNPSSTTSSTPSSPAPFQTSNPPSATPPPNPSPMGQRDGRFNFPAAYYIHHRQQFIFPEIPTPAQGVQPPETAENTNADEQPDPDGVEDHDAEMEEQELNKSEPEDDDDEIDDLPNRRPRWKGMISRKASQTSVYLQEWDIPFEQIDLGDPIGQGRWGRVYRGKWHGEVAIRLLETDGNNQDHLKLFKKEVMNYRQTRHENVVLFMGACMHPPHLAIITSFCKGRTLHSFVRDPKISLDINKTRQIAQEIIKGMGYLHAKGIVHKDLKSKNVFYENGKVVITDFGLFGISGVVQEGRFRRENELKLPHDWLCYLAPEIVREMAPGKDEDKLPFSKAADVYAFGTVWYELQARDWPFESQPAEALIWQIGSGEGVKQVLATISLGKEVSEILSACWAFDLGERPSFTLLMDMLEKLPKLNRRLSHPGHFWKSAEPWHHYYTKGLYNQRLNIYCPFIDK
ncbi:PREDICTED: kinase suppressor of Ras 1 isoform X2 [Gavialis gangeticus]|uniref:kinase suppressor of Ras 1 isoform X2 n=2 Tax=Gavialis gangeticus TaxID=94835 RepID=UPI00092EDE05|nr:PREDICTED: kinase suppressor of Ras 1 isoform X2 [Gavialis gangeticus]